MCRIYKAQNKYVIVHFFSCNEYSLLILAMILIKYFKSLRYL